MIAVVLALFALAAVVVLVWRGLREPTRAKPAEPARVSRSWLDDSRRSRDDD